MLKKFPNKWSLCTYEAKMTNSKKELIQKGESFSFVQDQLQGAYWKCHILILTKT